MIWKHNLLLFFHLIFNLVLHTTYFPVNHPHQDFHDQLPKFVKNTTCFETNESNFKICHLTFKSLLTWFTWTEVFLSLNLDFFLGIFGKTSTFSLPKQALIQFQHSIRYLRRWPKNIPSFDSTSRIQTYAQLDENSLMQAEQQ